jgi:hypothetical protein
VVDTLVPLDVFLGAVVVGKPIFPIGGADVSGRRILVKFPVVVVVVFVKLDIFLPVVVVVVFV